MINYNQTRSFFIFLIAIFAGIGNTSAQIDPVTFNVGCTSGIQSGSDCVQVTVDNFTNVGSYQFALNFDPNVIEITNIDTTGTCLPGMTPELFPINTGSQNFGYIPHLWYDNEGLSRTCPDGSILFTICFDYVGDPGDCTPININNTGIEFIVETDDIGDAPKIVNSCPVCVVSNGLTIVSAYCEASLADNDGSIKFFAVGGQENYNYNVTLLPSTPIASGILTEGEEWSQNGLVQGMYRLMVTDALGNTTSKTVSITQNFPIEFTFDTKNPSCYNRMNGSGEILNLMGGQNPYKIEWSNGYFQSQLVEQLGVGNYAVTVTDATGCELVKDFDLSVDTVKVTFEILDSLYCSTANDGRVLFKGSGGMPSNGVDYEFWLNSSRNSWREELLATTKLKQFNEIYIVDNAAVKCTSEVVYFEMPIKFEMQINEEILSNVVCKGQNNGRIRVSAEVGTETNFSFFHYELPGNTIYPKGTSSSNFYFNDSLMSGDYRIEVESNTKQCRDTVFFSITEPLEKLTLSSTVENPSCTGNDGQIVVIPMGGVTDYSYDWGIPSETTNQLNGLNGGDYKVVVTDMNGCMDSLDFTLPEGGNLVLEANVLSAISCSGDSDGSLIANINPAGAYTYVWTNAAGTIIGNSQIIENLVGGWYFVDASATGCSAIDSVFLPNPAGLKFEDVVITSPDCPNSNGNIGVVVSGGFPDYQYIWTECDSSNVLGISSVLAGVSPGTYNVVVSDQSGCDIDTCVTMLNPAKINVQVSNILKVDCANENSGSATASADGGSQGAITFSYLWSSGETGPVATMLSAGNGWVIASDTKCASDTLNFVVPDAEPLVAGVNFEPPSCAGDCDAFITVSPNGGTMSNFTVEWPGLGVTSNTITDLCPNTYEFIVRDGNGCELPGTVVVNAPDTLTLTIDSTLTKRVSCRTNTGQIGTETRGGNGNYMYAWTNNVSIQSVGIELPPASYTITVTDQKGCTATTSYILEPISLVTAVIPTPETPNCFGEVTCITVTDAGGGVGGPYSFQINSGPKFPLDTCVVVFAGQHRINVFDEAGCSLDTTLIISQPNPISVELGDDLEVVIGEEADIIRAMVDSDLGIDTIGWSLIDNFECLVSDDCMEIRVAPIVDQTVKVYVRDINGCDDTDELNITIKDIRQVYFPNIFSPDGDGINDYFQSAVGPGVDKINNLLIYDRWGNKLFTQSNYLPDPALTDGWDGNFNGEEMPPGVYVYYLQATFKDGRVLTYGGDITLIR